MPKMKPNMNAVKYRKLLTAREASTTALGMGAALAASLTQSQPVLVRKLRSKIFPWHTREGMPPIDLTRPPKTWPAFARLAVSLIRGLNEIVDADDPTRDHLGLGSRFWMGFNLEITDYRRPHMRWLSRRPSLMTPEAA